MGKLKSDAARARDAEAAYRRVNAENGQLRARVRQLETKLATYVPIKDYERDMARLRRLLVQSDAQANKALAMVREFFGKR